MTARAAILSEQLSLFASIRLEPYRFEAHVRELRAGICRTMGKILGETRVAEPCPECGCGIRVALHPHEALAWCDCGWVLPL